jgi:cytochrome bd-type quinol oxidase subunit 2
MGVLMQTLHDVQHTFLKRLALVSLLYCLLVVSWFLLCLLLRVITTMSGLWPLILLLVIVVVCPLMVLLHLLLRVSSAQPAYICTVFAVACIITKRALPAYTCTAFKTASVL